MDMSVDKSIKGNLIASKYSSHRDEFTRRTTVPSINSKPEAPIYYNKNSRTDASLVPPIRQTASIFKQPVTVFRNRECIVKHDLKYGPQEKPKQLFWEKRLDGFKPCDINGTLFSTTDLPAALQSAGPDISQETLLQSVATALHVHNHPITGQTTNENILKKNPGVYLNPDQPLIQAISISDEDIKEQEDRVENARQKLREAIEIIN